MYLILAILVLAGVYHICWSTQKGRADGKNLRVSGGRMLTDVASKQLL